MDSIEEGFDAQFNQYGQLVLQTNTPTGGVVQRMILRPAAALKLAAWLAVQDLEEVGRRARRSDPRALDET